MGMIGGHSGLAWALHLSVLDFKSAGPGVWISRNDCGVVGGRAEDEAGEGAGRTLQGPQELPMMWTLLTSGIWGSCVRGWPFLV